MHDAQRYLNLLILMHKLLIVLGHCSEGNSYPEPRFDEIPNNLTILPKLLTYTPKSKLLEVNVNSKTYCVILT